MDRIKEKEYKKMFSMQIQKVQEIDRGKDGCKISESIAIARMA